MEAREQQWAERPGGPSRFLWRLLAWSLLVFGALVPLAIMGAYSFKKTADSIRRSARAHNEITANVTAELVRREFDNAGHVARTIAQLPGTVHAVQQHDWDSLREELRVVVEASGRIDRIVVTAADGTPWCEYPAEADEIGIDSSLLDWYRDLERSEPGEESFYVSEVYRRPARPQPLTVAVASPVRDSHQRVLAVLVAQYRLNELTDWTRAIVLGRNGFVFVLDHAGHVAAHPKLDFHTPDSIRLEYDSAAPIRSALREGTQFVGQYRDPALHEEMWATARPMQIGRNNWIVVAQRPTQEIEAPIHELGGQIGVAAGVLALAALAVIGGLGVAGERIRGLNEQLQERAGALAKSEHKLLKQTTILESILANMADGVVVADEKGRILSFNPMARTILGIGPDETPPAESSSISGLYMADTVTPIPPAQMPIMQAVRGEAVDEVEEFVRLPDTSAGTWISISARPLRDERGAVRGGVSVFRDITDRKRGERRLAAQHATARVLAESATLNEATPRILQAICESLDWDVGAIWRPVQGVLRCVETWHRVGADYTDFEARTRESTFQSGIGLPGRVWETGQPAWIADVTQDSNFPRAAFAARAGFHGAFGFPIVLKDEILGVIEFFSREVRKPDDDILRMLGTIGSQIGQFIERRRAEEALRESEQRLQSILDNTTAVIYAKDRRGRYLLINRQYETLFHITRQQVVGKTDYDLFPAEMAAAFDANDRTVFDAGRAMEFDEVAPQDDGLHAYLSIKFPLYDGAGTTYAVCGISTDITDRKRTEQALQHERYLLHTLMDNVPDAIYFKDAQSRFIRINRALAGKSGLADPAEAIGKTDFDFFTPEHAQAALEDEQRVMRTGKPMVGKEEKETWPGGRESWVLTSKLPLRDSDGRIVGTFGMSRDITNRKRAELALRDSEALYHSLVDSLPLNVIRKDLEGRVTFGNSLYCKSMGTSLEGLVGKTDYDLFPQELAQKYRQDDQQVTATGSVLETVEEHVTPSGERLYVQVLKSPVYDSRNAIVGTQVIYWDVTARKRAEDAVQNSERRYRAFTEGSQDAVVVADQNGKITLFNRSAQKTFGYSEAEVLGQSVTMLMPEQFHEAHRLGLARYLKTREAHVVGRTIELRGRRKSGEVFPLDMSLTALDQPDGVSFLAAIRDITDRHRMQHRVIQSEKMASLGLMSAGVAHEINNPLAFVANNLAVLDRDVKGMKCLLAAYSAAHATIASHAPEQATRIADLAQEIDLAYLNENIDRILDSTRQGVKRVADIVQNLRGFARLDQAAVDRVDVHAAIRSSLELIQGRLNRRNITVEQRFGEVPPLSCSPAQINQVFLNLLVNATQAIETTRKSQGLIKITTRVAGSDMVIEIADNGCGIDPDLLPKVFDPFFTTKKIGEGTGLGLSITHGIVNDHHGEIEVESSLGEGTCFRVMLPLNRKERP
jgi:PAS domain S-box-containing protein